MEIAISGISAYCCVTSQCKVMLRHNRHHDVTMQRWQLNSQRGYLAVQICIRCALYCWIFLYGFFVVLFITMAVISRSKRFISYRIIFKLLMSFLVVIFQTTFHVVKQSNLSFFQRKLLLCLWLTWQFYEWKLNLPFSL